MKLPQEDISNLIIRYLVGKKISRQYKKLIFSAIKHACEMNEVILNWKKMKKIVKLFDTGGKNETKAIVTRFFSDNIRSMFTSIMPLENLNSITVYDRLYYNFFIMIKIFYILVGGISIILKKNNKKLKKIDKFIYELFRS